MKGLIVSLSILLLVGICGTVLAFNPAQTELRYYAFVRDADMPTMDGVFSPGEWDFAPADFVYRMSDWWGADNKSGPRASGGVDPHDYSDYDVPFLFFGWNPGSNSIIWGFQVVDDIFYAPWNYYETFKGADSIYWYMDADGDGGQYQYWDKTGTDGQQGIFRYDETAEYTAHIGAYDTEGSDWAFTPPYVHLGLTVDPVTGSATVEMSMQVFDWMEYESTGGPGKSIVHQLTAGEIIGARWTIYDQDSEAEDVDYAMLSFNAPYNLEADNAFTADDFTQWMVLSEADTYGGQVAVESTSWGKVKALLR